MSYEQIFLLGVLIMLFAFLSGVYAFRNIDFPSKIICFLLLITILNEKIGQYSAVHFNNSNIIYAIFSPIEICTISIYFNYSIDSFKKNRIGIYIGLLGFILGLIDLVIQDPKHMNNFFLLTESIFVVAMCFYAFYRMLLSDDDLILRKHPHFWFTTIFLFFWTSTFLIWGLYDTMIEKFGVNDQILHLTLLYVNIITYLGFGFVFIFYKKMKPINE